MRDEQRTTTSEDSATQLLICEALSLAIWLLHCEGMCYYLHQLLLIQHKDAKGGMKPCID